MHARHGAEGSSVHALVMAYLRFVAEHTAAARFIHSAPWPTFAPQHAALVAGAKEPRARRLLEWVRPHVVAGRVVDLPDPLTEMTARRRPVGAPDIDLEQAMTLLPERVCRSVQARSGPLTALPVMSLFSLCGIHPLVTTSTSV